MVLNMDPIKIFENTTQSSDYGADGPNPRSGMRMIWEQYNYLRRSLHQTSSNNTSQQSLVVPKIEPAEYEDRNDSGINSGSDIHSSPESESREQPAVRSPLYCSPFGTIYPAVEANEVPSASRNLTTPSDFCLSKIPTVPAQNSMAQLNDFNRVMLQRLANELPIPGILEYTRKEHELDKKKPSKKEDPTSNSTSEQKGSTAGDLDFLRDISEPAVNSHGKIKKYTCKPCGYTAFTKAEKWEHLKTHIKPSKALKCDKCPFVTEYKHHFEYHIIKHSGDKPFKCGKCEYTCINKSMLNSHLKSHSTIYQFSCETCGYMTNHVHSLKSHLIKYDHQSGIPLNPDGTPNPDIIIDVYGKRRGPRSKTKKMENQEVDTGKNAFAPYNPPPMQLPIPAFPLLPGIDPGNILQNYQQVAQQYAALLQAQMNALPVKPVTTDEALDLSKPYQGGRQRPRKGPAFRRRPSADVDEDSDPTDDTLDSDQKVTDSHYPQTENNNNNNNTKEEYVCRYCSINYGDLELYSLHMDFHGTENPFLCRKCGVKCEDKVSFHQHILRYYHS